MARKAKGKKRAPVREPGPQRPPKKARGRRSSSSAAPEAEKKKD